MNRFVNAIIIGIVVFFVAVTAIWFAVRSGSSNALEAEILKNEWGGGDEPVLESTLSLQNGLSRDAELKQVEYQFLVGDEPVANGTSDVEGSIPRGKEDTVVIKTELPGHVALKWWEEHLNDDEASTLRLQGQAVFDVGRDTERASFDASWEIETDLLDDLRRNLRGCPDEPDDPCLEDIDLDWKRQEQDIGVLHYDITVRNPYEFPIYIVEQNASFVWAGVPVANGSAEGEVRIDAGGSEDVELDLFLDGRQIMDWWSAHVESCEQTLVRLDGTLTFRERPDDTNATEQVHTGALKWRSPEARIQTGIACGRTEPGST